MTRTANENDISASNSIKEFVTFLVGNSMFGIPVQQVQEVLTWQQITPVPLAPSEVAGLLNLRGQIVSAIELRERLQINEGEQNPEKRTNIVVSDGGELFSLQVDEVGDVLGIPINSVETPPSTLDDHWHRFCTGVYRLDKGLLIEISVTSLLDFE